MNKKPLIPLIFCFFIFSLGIFALSKKEVNIYIAGNYGKGGQLTTDIACFWSNGTRTDLTPSGARTISIYVSGKDVYVAGYYSKDGTKACYWKNGVKTDLAIDKESYTSSIYISGKDIYVAGHYIKGNTTIACYWKNGIKTDLSNEESSYTRSIYVDKKDVYVAGFYFEEKKCTACYWKNGTRINLDNLSSNLFSIASSIFVAGNDIYVAGQYNDKSKDIACYWKNGIKTDLTSIPNAITGKTNTFVSYEKAMIYHFSRQKGILSYKVEVNSIYINNSDVYIAGKYNDGQKDVACYWKNGIKNDLNSTSKNPGAASIFIHETDVYAVGHDDGACYWKNGVKTKIGNGIDNPRANSIFVVEK